MRKNTIHSILTVAGLSILMSFALVAQAQTPSWQPNLTQQQTYAVHRASSADPTGQTMTSAPSLPETHLPCSTPTAREPSPMCGSPSPYHLKRIVLRMYWDGETTPSVEAPIGNFFGLGLGTYHSWHSELLSVGNNNSLNSFFPMPFAKHARITVTNEGEEPINSLYYNIDYRTYSHPLEPGTLYFHAQYRQAQPTPGWTNKWK